MNDYNKATNEVNYLFDVDGTLTPSRLSIDPEFKQFFLNWIKGKKVYLVTGSDYSKSEEQLGREILESVTLCYNNAGNLHCSEGKEIYKLEWTPPQELLDFLNQLLKESPYPVRAGNHIEHRIGMINFSVVGRDCTYEQRLDYNRYDNEKQERKRIIELIMKKFPDLEASIGGQISVDIYPKGKNKGQVVDFLCGPIIFFGDRTEPGGNDYEIAARLNTSPHKVIQVKDWRETYEYLKKM
jgi:phosphomannomutase